MTWERKEWHRFIIPIFLHADLIQIATHLLIQLIIGSIMEYLLNLKLTAAIYILSGIGGVIFSTCFNNTITAGASGSVLGLCGAFVLFFNNHIAWMDNTELGNT